MTQAELIDKYNVPGPRYTSYPTVPFWDQENFSIDQWLQTIKEGFWQNGREISLYLHLPFCESLCTYCGCNTHITVNHTWEDRYIDVLLKEWKLYLDHLPGKPIIKELHLGGGTPTFFQPNRLEYLLKKIFENAEIADDVIMGFEGHPLNTTYDHLRTLRELGFSRLSLGIQDFDPSVQKLINRKQSVEEVKVITTSARELGYNSINFDLVYGLPGQTKQTIAYTIGETILLQPDRIAFYGYAHVPWIKPAQRSLTPHLPSSQEKSKLYQIGKAMLTGSGYKDIGMDHFALEADALNKAAEKGELHRNFMGYTTQPTYFTLGLGTSAISDSWTSFAQNEKNLKKYMNLVNKGEFPVSRGHMLSFEDLIVRKHILQLMCQYHTKWRDQEIELLGLDLDTELLMELEKDGLISLEGNELIVLNKGKAFIRNICMAFDVRLSRKQPQKQVFSKTV